MPLETKVERREDAPKKAIKKGKWFERENEWMGMEEGNGRILDV
jgi:hypothetical protein